MKTNESSQKSTIINSNKYLYMSLDKLEKEIEVLTELMEGYEKEKNFIEAHSVQQELIQATKAKDKLKLEDTKFRHIQERETLHLYEQDEFIKLNSKMDKKREKLKLKFEKMQNQLKKNQEEEIQKFQKAQEDKYKSSIKPSNEILTIEKKKESFLKKKEYDKLYYILIF
jgi:hypothetical protein